MSAESERALAARIANHTRWATTTDRAAGTEAARAKFLERFELEVDPNGDLPPAERKRRAAHARKAHMLRLALASAKARKGAA